MITMQKASILLALFLISFCTPATASPFTEDNTIPIDCFDLSKSSLLKQYYNLTVTKHERVSGWKCSEYSWQFKTDNPEWGTLTTSLSWDFCPSSHMVNYIAIDNCSILVYDGLEDEFRVFKNIQWDNSEYFKFWFEGETPLKYYSRLSDNKIEWKNRVDMGVIPTLQL